MLGKKANGKNIYFFFAWDSSGLDAVHSQFPLTEITSIRTEGTASKSNEIILLRQIMIFSSRSS